MSAAMQRVAAHWERRAPDRAGAARSRMAPAPAAPAARVLALQRDVGNAATRRLLRKTGTDRFRVVVVPDGETGMSKAAVNRALTVVRQELASVTKASRDETVRRGVEVEYREKEGDLTDLHRRVFLVYLMPSRDPDRAVELAKPHLKRGYDSDLRDAAHELASIGGTNLRIDFNLKSMSVSLVSTSALASLVGERKDGEQIASRLLGEIILHEVAHGLRVEHSGGIMEGKAVFDARTLGKPRHFDSDSAEAIRKRLEWLAER